MNTDEFKSLLREDVINEICNTFLDFNIYSAFHPKDDGYSFNRKATNAYFKHSQAITYYGFGSMANQYLQDTYVRFNSFELKEAVRRLQEQGYNFFRIYQYSTWEGYVCSKATSYAHGEKVTEINLPADFDEIK